MRHLGNSRVKLFMRYTAIAVVALWMVTLYFSSQHDGPAVGDDGSPRQRLLSFTGALRSAAGVYVDEDDPRQALARERQERLALEERFDRLLTKQQDLQGQLDILRQQMPLPEERTEGAAKPPEIGYTRWAKNYYNTRRDDNDNDNDEPTRDDAEEPVKAALSSEPTDASMQVGIKRAGLAGREEGLESSEGGKCVLPHKVDYTKNFWTGHGDSAFTGCCRAGTQCGNYQLDLASRRLWSRCGTQATVSWSSGSKTLEPNRFFSLSVVPIELQYLKFTCGAVEELVVLPATNTEAHLRVLNKTTINPAASAAKPNVVVLMIDAVSRAQFIRALPKTVELFQNWQDKDRFSVFDFEFFGTLGAYSPPNRYAFFSGFPFSDDQAFFEGSPFPAEEKVLRVHEKQDVWMWDVLSAEGYMTFSARDMCSRMAAFVYDDFVSRPWTDIHFQDIFCDHRYRGHELSAEHCMLTRNAHQYVLEAGALFHETHTDVPRFTYLDFAEGHEPSMQVLRTMDKDLIEVLPRFLADQNTIVVLASDHGIGYGKQHITRDGPLEERLPALFMIAPNRVLAKEARAQLAQNSRKLVTGLDVFATVTDLAGASSANERRPWARSLVRDMPSRNCREAGINVHACPCSLWDGTAKSRIAWR